MKPRHEVPWTQVQTRPALIVSREVGAYLVAAGLLGHTAWDVYHHRGNTVVVRSMAELCCVLDTLLAVAIVIAAVRD